jgi:hypothetical protein
MRFEGEVCGLPYLEQVFTVRWVEVSLLEVGTPKVCLCHTIKDRNS